MCQNPARPQGPPGSVGPQAHLRIFGAFCSNVRAHWVCKTVEGLNHRFALYITAKKRDFCALLTIKYTDLQSNGIRAISITLLLETSLE